MNRLKEFYEAEIVDAMTKKFSYKNKMAVPKLEKIVINMGVGEAKDNAKVLDGAVVEVTKIVSPETILGSAFIKLFGEAKKKLIPANTVALGKGAESVKDQIKK